MKGTERVTTVTVLSIIAILLLMCCFAIFFTKHYINNNADKNNPLENSEMVDSICINNDSTGLLIAGLENYGKCEFESHNMYMISESEEPVYMHIKDSCNICSNDTVNDIPSVTFIRIKWQFKQK